MSYDPPGAQPPGPPPQQPPTDPYAVPPPAGYPPPGYAPPPPGYGQPPPGYAQPANPYGQPPGYGAPPPYGYPPAGYGYPTPQTAGKAIGVLILGIGSLVFLCAGGFVLAIIALCLAPSARRDIAASQGRVTGEGQLKGGVICSWIAIGFTVLAVALLVFGIVAGRSPS
jgi:hypothetical protein